MVSYYTVPYYVKEVKGITNNVQKIKNAKAGREILITFAFFNN